MTNQAHELNTAYSHYGITEVVLATKQDACTMVLPMLAHLSSQTPNKWLTWVAPNNVSKSVLHDYGFSLNNLRLIHCKHDSQRLKALCTALSNGNSSTVVANLESLSDQDRQKLERAAYIGNTRGVILSSRIQPHSL